MLSANDLIKDTRINVRSPNVRWFQDGAQLRMIVTISKHDDTHNVWSIR